MMLAAGIIFFLADEVLTSIHYRFDTMFELVIFCGLYFTYFKKRFAGLLQLASEEIWLSPMSDSINKHAYLHKVYISL